MADLAEYQYQLGTDGLLFGRGTPITVEVVDFGAADAVTVDTDRAREDGIRFGRDFFGARTIAFDLNVLTRGSAASVLDELARAWRADAVRSVPSGVVPLRWRREGRSRRVYGRPRGHLPVTGAVSRGWVPASVDFRTVDDLFYDDDERSATVSITAQAAGGLGPPLQPPIALSPSGLGRTPIVVDGTEQAWLTQVIHGPISDPVIEVVGQWTATLGSFIAADQAVVVDPTPWARTVRRTDGANLAGAFTADSQRLSAMRIPPGEHEVILRGASATGTAYCELFWRGAHASF